MYSAAAGLKNVKKNFFSLHFIIICIILLLITPKSSIFRRIVFFGELFVPFHIPFFPFHSLLFPFFRWIIISSALHSFPFPFLFFFSCVVNIVLLFTSVAVNIVPVIYFSGQKKKKEKIPEKQKEVLLHHQFIFIPLISRNYILFRYVPLMHFNLFKYRASYHVIHQLIVYLHTN